jgi:hypothetical protein
MKPTLRMTCTRILFVMLCAAAATAEEADGRGRIAFLTVHQKVSEP